MRVTRKRIAWSVALLVIGAAATAAMWPEPEPVETARAERGPFRVTVSAEARTRTRFRFVVTAPVTGRLQRIRLRPGDDVRSGEPVAIVAPLPMDNASVEAARGRVAAAEAAQRDAEARVRQAKEASALAARMAERYREVERVGGVSRQQVEEAALSAMMRGEDLVAAEARVRAANAELWAARAALPPHGEAGYARSVVVQAPAAGRVLGVPEESERIVTAGTPLIELGRPGDLEIVADVLSEDAVRMAPGAEVELAGWGGDVLLRGAVRSIEPAARTSISALGVDEQRVSVIIAPNSMPRSLGDGYRLDARITVWKAEQVLAVPASAVFSAGDEYRVFVLVGDRAWERTVRVGQRSEAAVEILEGLMDGDEVVLFPSDRIHAGTRVRPNNQRG
jgi:HlyD family secretion protein